MTWAYSNPKYITVDGKFISCIVSHPVFGSIPYTASSTDPDASGSALYVSIIANQTTIPIAPYVPPVAPVAPVVPPPTLAQSAQTAYNAAIAAGVAITSTGTPTLNGTYALDQTSLGRITSEQVYITNTSKFTNGQTTRGWLDSSGTPHMFPSITEFTAFAETIALYDDALITALTVGLAGGAWVAPLPPASIP
jgi:hypothetical protein